MKTFEQPKMEVQRFQVEDIITTSGVNPAGIELPDEVIDE